MKSFSLEHTDVATDESTLRNWQYDNRDPLGAASGTTCKFPSINSSETKRSRCLSETQTEETVELVIFTSRKHVLEQIDHQRSDVTLKVGPLDLLRAVVQLTRLPSSPLRCIFGDHDRFFAQYLCPHHPANHDPACIGRQEVSP